MRHKTFSLTLAVAAAALVLPVAAMADDTRPVGEAERAGGPLRQAGVGPVSSIMVTAPSPQTAPVALVEYWQWMFLKERQPILLTHYDTLAFRMVADCAAGTTRRLGTEYYREGRYLNHGDANAQPPTTPEAGTMGMTVFRLVCEPGYEFSPNTLPDHATARAAITRHYAAQTQ